LYLATLHVWNQMINNYGMAKSDIKIFDFRHW